MPCGLLTAYGDTGEKQAQNPLFYTISIMTSGVQHDRIQLSREERSRNDAPDHVLNQKPYAENYLQDGRCSLSNNPSENSIRPFTVGRKNWLFCDTPGGAHASSSVYTMVEMAKAHGLNVEKYLTFLLQKRPHADMTDEELEKLAPWSEETRIFCGFAQQIAFT